jgi:tetratricopeptide (TPR) repeat protein
MEDERMRVRARARKKKRRRQMKMLIGICLVLIVVLVGAAVYGIMRFQREKKKQELLTEGISLLDAGSYDEAISRLDDALKWSNGKKVGEFELSVLLYRAEAEFRLKDYDAALNTYELLLKEDKENTEYKKGAARCLVEKKDYDGALAYGVIDGYVYNLKAVEQINAGEYDAALELIRQGLEAGDSVQDLSYNQAVAWENKGDFAKALELFEAYAAQYGTDENVERELTFLRSRQGNASDDEVGVGEEGAATQAEDGGETNSDNNTETESGADGAESGQGSGENQQGAGSVG